ncbi:MAG: ABC transporter ATP-binding protein, partial [Bacteroidales bacterium]|nr:ABC transporter ATP-binding protein [Bacteroidales bacterium]
VICFNHVSKEYKLFKNSKHRLRSVFLKNTKYKIKKAVNDVSFSVKKGDSVAIFGRNGAGKSTVLKMITEVSYPTTGDIMVKGRVSALLELTSGFDPEFTGRENIYLKGSILGLSQREIAEIEQEIIEFSEIEEYIDQPVRTYSSGMKARLGFSINVNIRPEILIIDEALSVGDEAFRNKCSEKVNSIIEMNNVTLLFVTHSTNVARSFCKRGIIMDKGTVIFDGDIDEAIEKYGAMFRKKKATK